MDSIQQILDEIVRTDQSSVLATIIRVEGSAYRKEGTSMLFLANGQQVGIISAGCLETDLAIQAKNLFYNDTIHSRTIVYDMSAEDDLSWGRGAGCNGKIHILLEKITPELKKQLGTLHNNLSQGTSVTIFKRLGKVVRSVFVTEDHHIFGKQDTVSDHFIQGALDGKRSGIQYVEDVEANVYIHTYKPKPRLFIFGAGPDVVPFSSMAAQTGFSITIWDWRPANLDQVRFPDAQLADPVSIPEIIKKIDFTPTDSVIIMTHDFQKDKQLLHRLLEYKQLRYLGILGPRNRTTRLLNGANIPDHLRSPVGLAISAEGPNEIAISIIAELIHVLRESPNEKERTFEKARNRRYLSSSG
ncbi:XdhC family protein [Lentibacillus sp. Marseille-P4043]|uniref:XdhC family protein n=1 Tax=Lentibacillus sp. Marseille-P4043 TaxID=2040293 RepID=UPI000D0AD972|nr:XdhC family protein [Lentibacillus sp. Marseille-P4043]